MSGALPAAVQGRHNYCVLPPSTPCPALNHPPPLKQIHRVGGGRRGRTCSGFFPSLSGVSDFSEFWPREPSGNPAGRGRPSTTDVAPELRAMYELNLEPSLSKTGWVYAFWDQFWAFLKLSWGSQNWILRHCPVLSLEIQMWHRDIYVYQLPGSDILGLY